MTSNIRLNYEKVMREAARLDGEENVFEEQIKKISVVTDHSLAILGSFPSYFIHDHYISLQLLRHTLCFFFRMLNSCCNQLN